MNWLGLGIRIAKAVIIGANAIEGTATSLKGDDKRALALQVARDAMTLCGSAIVTTPEIQKALDDYNDAYVKLQNVIAAVA